MKKLTLTVLLSCLLFTSGCSFLQDSGAALCEAETKVSASITKAAGQVGFLGAAPLIGEFLTTGLELFCHVLDAGLSAPQDLSEAVGLVAPAVVDEGGSDEGGAE